MNEEQTKLDKINPALFAAGWNQVPESKILMEQSAYEIAPGRVGKIKKHPMKADYVLTYRNQKLAVIEAKGDDADVSVGVENAKIYAERLQIRFTYVANGDEIYCMDMVTGEERFVDRFPTPQELWDWTFPDENPWRDIFNETPFWIGDRTPRYYQEIAVNRVMQAISQKKRRMLLTLATGTGKTFIAFQIVWKLYQTRWNLMAAGDPDQRKLPRILFLADRNILAGQAFNDFRGIPETDRGRVTPNDIRKNGGVVPKGPSIYFTIFQTIMSGTEPYYKQYPPDFFDFIIIDECHRGGANDESEWREILTYFEPAYQLGMTATPKRDKNVDTYRYFGEPLYTYSLKQGIEDGFLTPFRVERGTTNIDEYQYDEDDIIVSGEEYLDKDKVYEEKDFYQGRIKIRERDEFRIRELMEKIDPHDKTIVFCATQNHAMQIRDMINRHSKAKHPSYCVRVTANDGEKGEEFLRTFQQNDKKIPTVLTTSQKLSTGVDARNVRNIVLLRSVNSMIEFKQIIGRGTRLFSNKYYFTIYDFSGASERFKDPDWDGEPICPRCGNVPCTCNDPGPHPCPICGNLPCTCERAPSPPPQPCPICGNLPCTCEGGNTRCVVIKLSKHRSMNLQIEWNQGFWFDGGVISTDEFIQKLFGHLSQFCGSEEDLREKWSRPDTRAEFLEQLRLAGFGKDKLEQLQSVISAKDCDLLDVLEYVAYDKKMLERAQRAEVAREAIKTHYQGNERQFLDFVLTQYVSVGYDVLSQDRITSLLNLKYGSVPDAVKVLGNPNKIRRTFADFQRFLYTA